VNIKNLLHNTLSTKWLMGESRPIHTFQKDHSKNV